MNEDEYEKTEEKANKDKNAFAKSIMLGFLSGIQDLFLKLWKLVKSLWEEIKKQKPLVILTGLIVLANGVLAYYTYQSNERTEKLFVGQNKPLIDVTPISITSGESETGAKMALTTFSVVNYSGFVAYNIAIDVKYPESNTWISEWLKADHDKKTEEPGVVIGKTFLTAPKAPTSNALKELKPGGRAISKHNGQLDLEKTVGNAGNDGHTVLVRVTWENDSGHVFDEIHQYNLLCAESGPGRSFTFIPEGVISQKN